ncbi:unnamed protein product [Rotaria sordida]|uniref:Uncharacterized protein n=1 Tax=Rotaria sordida TaxID=392033 RepID=A0A813V582_9BILA|nr:unnamed protein product [Rotaria sordida]CAF0835337.1 unnamed protein product [Rotaria sordida]CAF3976128.1 unnamed protein product [Rotaria sordida]CAF4072657.1 unnamed protein product [Rotaria sordida]
MTKIILLILVTVILCVTVEHCQARNNDADFRENRKEIMQSKLKRLSIHKDRIRRQNDESMSNVDTAGTVLSILPLDRIGTIVGQIMSTGLKEMFNPNVGTKIVNVLENQAPLLLTSLFTNLYTTLSVPGKVPPKTNSSISSISMNNNTVKQLSNSSTSEIMNAIRRPAAK